MCIRDRCANCRQAEAADAASAKLIGVKAGTRIWRAGGCPVCNHTGHQGRIGVYEMIRVDDRVRRLIAAEAGEDAITAVAFDKGADLASRARDLVLAGTTSLEEAVRVIRQDGSAPSEEAAA